MAFELDSSEQPPSATEASSDLVPRAGQAILDVVSPYLAGVTEAVRPLLAAHGLNLEEATVGQLLERETLADEVLQAAVAVVRRVHAVGLYPSDLRLAQTAPAVPAGWEPERLERRLIAGFDAAVPPRAQPHPAAPSGWAMGRASSPRHLGYDSDGEPCYPDTPAFEGYWPKCSQAEPEAPSEAVPCTEDARFVRAEQRLWSLRHFERIPSSFRGFDYPLRLKQSVSQPLAELYRCGERPSSPNTLASWVGPPGPRVIRLYERFLDLEFEWDVLSVLTGPVDFRAAVLLHEHVHRIEDPEMGTVSAPPERSYDPAGSVGQQDCPWSGTEYDAAYVQALYLGGGEALARVVADIYGRAQCEQIGRTALLLAAAGDIIEALALGWVASIEVVVALTARLTGEGALDFLTALFSAELSALILLGLPR